MTAPFILRRLKRDVLGELPPKMETVLTVSMEEEQHKLYAANAMEARQRLRQEGASLGSNKLAVLAVLTRLRQICCDPALCYEDYQGGERQAGELHGAAVRGRGGGAQGAAFLPVHLYAGDHPPPAGGGRGCGIICFRVPPLRRSGPPG